MTIDLPDALARIHGLDIPGLDALGFGVIAFDDNGLVQRYSACESRYSGLLPAQVIGRHLFKDIAPCMNNHLVARRFEAAMAGGSSLDATIDYLLTWRMRPTQVRLRLLHEPTCTLSYLLLTPKDPAFTPRPLSELAQLL